MASTMPGAQIPCVICQSAHARHVRICAVSGISVYDPESVSGHKSLSMRLATYVNHPRHQSCATVKQTIMLQI